MSAETDAAYALLGLRPGATKAQVNRSWRHLALDVHPDTHHDWTAVEKQRADERMKQLNAAHDLLKALFRDGAAPSPPPPASPPPGSRPDSDTPHPWFDPDF